MTRINDLCAAFAEKDTSFTLIKSWEYTPLHQDVSLRILKTNLEGHR